MSSEKNAYPRIIPVRTCKKCGKQFISAVEHMYRDHGAWYCSWTCYKHRNDWGDFKNDKGRA